MVREACGEVRKAANEVLEMIRELEVDHVGEASELAGHWQVVLSAYRLALWATATADPTNSALRATQALQNIVAPLGQFFWRHLETGHVASYVQPAVRCDLTSITMKQNYYETSQGEQCWV